MSEGFCCLSTYVYFSYAEFLWNVHACEQILQHCRYVVDVGA